MYGKTASEWVLTWEKERPNNLIKSALSQSWTNDVTVYI